MEWSGQRCQYCRCTCNSCLYPATFNPIDVEACDILKYKITYNFADIYFRKKYLNNIKEYDISKILLDGDLDIIASAETDFLAATYYMCSAVSDKELKSDKPMKGLRKLINRPIGIYLGC